MMTGEGVGAIEQILVMVPPIIVFVLECTLLMPWAPFRYNRGLPLPIVDTVVFSIYLERHIPKCSYE